MKKYRDESSIGNVEGEVNYPTLRSWLANYRKHLLWGPVGLGAAIAFFAPTDVLQFTWAKMIVDVMGSFIPMINRLDAPFELTQVAQLYYSVMWAFLPIIYYSLEVGDREKLVLKLKSNRSLFWWPIIFFGFVWIGVFFMLSYASPDPTEIGPRDSMMLHSRVGMATYGGMMVTGLAALPKLVIRVAGCFPDIYPKGDKK